MFNIDDLINLRYENVQCTEHCPEEQDRIIGAIFNEDNKIQHYLYESEKDVINNLDANYLLMDDELVQYCIQENRKYEVMYTGEYKKSLNILSKNLFIEAQPIIVETVVDERDKKIDELTEKINKLESLLIQVINN